MSIKNYVSHKASKVVSLTTDYMEKKRDLEASAHYLEGINQDVLFERNDLARRIKLAKKYVKGNKLLKDFTEKDLLAILDGKE